MKKTLSIVTLAILSLAAQAQTPNPARAHVQAFEAWHAARAGLPAAPAVTPDIIGGETAPPGRFPGMVALLFAPVADNHAAFYCGGTLVSDRHVLTAAHCADFVAAADVQVLVGTQSLASGGSRVAVSQVTVHPQWNPDLLSSDVAVLTLAAPVTGIQPVLFIGGSKGETRFAPVGAGAVLAGWGWTDNAGTVPDDLQQAALTVKSPNECAFNDTVMCAGASQATPGACSGDSGGPLFSSQQVRGRWVQVGVTSYGTFPCGLGFPDGYARLGVLGAWVRQIIQQP